VLCSTAILLNDLQAILLRDYINIHEWGGGECVLELLIVPFYMRDSSGKPTAERGLETHSPIRRDMPNINLSYTNNVYQKKCLPAELRFGTLYGQALHFNTSDLLQQKSKGLYNYIFNLK
jgi:hypothetical protein